MDTKPLRSDTMSPGRPIRRLTKVPPSPHFTAASGGVLKTMMSPREGELKSRQIRHASTRSEKCASQPGLPGDRAQWRVGSIDEDGIRYGFTIHCFSARTIRMAPMIVTAQSIAIRHWRGRFRVRRSTGFHEWRLRAGCPYVGLAPGTLAWS